MFLPLSFLTSVLVLPLLQMKSMVLTSSLFLAQAAGGGNTCPNGTIRLLQPIDGKICMEIDPNWGALGAFKVYFNLLYPWVVGCAAGIAILWGVYGGAMMIVNAGDQGKYEEHKQKLVHALIGIAIIIFSAMILNFIDPTAYSF